MTDTPIARHKTALSRTGLSRPISTAIADGLLGQDNTVFDYGCGKGDDIRHLLALGYAIEGWDPVHRPNVDRRAAEVVNLGYVLNVIESKKERAQTLQSAWALATGLLVVSARLTWDGRNLGGRPLGDGVITRTGTFQKFYEQTELADWIEQTLDVKPYAAAPGVFYVFRDKAAAHRFTASRIYTYRPRITIDPHVLYEGNQKTLAPLLSFMQAHARPPRPVELQREELLRIQDVLGSVGRAERLIRQVTSDSYWEQVVLRRRAELLIYVALSRFGRRPSFSQLDRVLGADIRMLFGAYREACLQGDRLLLACGNQAKLFMSARSSKIGKQTPTALYVHHSAMAQIPPILQVYEGCARVLAGTVEHANMIKLSVAEPKVSYLSYPDFDRVPHPTLQSAVTVNLRNLTVDFRDYRTSENPPLLHRKEEFLGPDDTNRTRYARLTRSEMKAGLYDHPECIGTLKGWMETLEAAHVKIQGHRLIRG
ncbi:DNA phosphorothioation-associated putative methyltransferase [Arthrobacter sp. CAU 1506]|uniref:DNA phosphorothioation-associated putative methyltransferase n=1 Tax=Arthrobacter sp. CAU 1506 TaxID=2560052 RepID=UPI0010ACBD49|nr:DNA phosphorothioation-associated putative methyltransferase [Arthrobacter sp. CAU 1506]TJY69477.1 DNA phosphorothioation-associated putative methyltransferase [Arthrobacter sp. CAU 1506]